MIRHCQLVVRMYFIFNKREQIFNLIKVHTYLLQSSAMRFWTILVVRLQNLQSSSQIDICESVTSGILCGNVLTFNTQDMKTNVVLVSGFSASVVFLSIPMTCTKRWQKYNGTQQKPYLYISHICY